jgi:hypothetical protein
MNCLASKTTHTYLGFLDNACLFQLLVRLHYEDLMNLCKCRTYLWKIVCTPWFQQEWKKYNITIVKTAHAVMERDRLDINHGLTERYSPYSNEKRLRVIQQYHQGVLQSSKECLSMTRTIKYTYIDNVQYDYTITQYSDGWVAYASHKNDRAHG